MFISSLNKDTTMTMKRHLSLIVATALSCTFAVAQLPGRKMGIFNHISVGGEIGTAGYGIELSSPLTRFVSVRAGFCTIPGISYDTDIDYESNIGFDHTIDLDAKLHLSNWKLLADVYPIPGTSFHVTAGFYVGKSGLLTAQNNIPLLIGEGIGYDLLYGEGLQVGDYVITPDADGIIRARLGVNQVKPYLGFGFGRSVSKRKLISLACDLGVQLWGKPTLDLWSPNDNQWVELHRKDIDDEDFQDAYKIINKITVYPVLNLRLYFNVL